MYNPYQKKRTKLAVQILVAIAIVILILIGSIFVIVHKEKNMRMACEKIAQEKFDELKDTLHDEMISAQKPAEDFLQNLYNIHFDFTNEENIYQSMESLMRRNPNISGSIMIFENWMYPSYADKNGFCPLIRRKEDGGTERLQIGEFRDVRNENEWYIQQRESHQRAWSHPFFSDDGVIIVTYTIPMFDTSGKYMGGFGIDLDLTNLSMHAEQYKPFPTTTVVVIDEDLSIIVHPNPDYVINKKLPEVMKRVGMDPDSPQFVEARKSDSGKVYAELGKRKIVFFHGHIPETHWKVILYCPADAIYEPIGDMITKYLMICAGLLLVSVIFLVYSIIKYRKFKKSLLFMAD